MTTAAVVSRRTLWCGVFWCALAATLVLALRPSGAGPSVPHVDKLQHAAAFITLWFLGVRAGWQRSTWWLAAGLALFGLGIEVAQSFTPDRDPSWADVGADLLGIAVGAWATRRSG